MLLSKNEIRSGFGGGKGLEDTEEVEEEKVMRGEEVVKEKKQKKE